MEGRISRVDLLESVDSDVTASNVEE